MAKTIGQLNPATTIGNSDLFVIEQSSQTFKIAASVVRGGLVDADIDAAAAIAYSKLDLDDSIVAGDLTADAVTTAKILDANVTTGKVADAAITAPKLSGAQTGSAPIYGCRAWVNFDGTRNEADTGASTNGANVKIRANGNVASVLKNGTGDYTITFTTAMPDANYSFAFGAGADAVIGLPTLSAKSAVAPTASALRVATDNGANQGATNDIAHCCVQVFR